MAARSVLWSSIDPERHFGLIDDALDTNDAEHGRIRTEIKAELSEMRTEMKAGFAKCEEDSRRGNRLLVGLLVAIVASSFAIVFTVAAFGSPT